MWSKRGEENEEFFNPILTNYTGLFLLSALKDFINCEKLMSREGTICFHDVVPFNGQMTTRDENYLSIGTAWTGDVWKMIPVLQEFRPDLDIRVLGCAPTGLVLIRNLELRRAGFLP